MSVDNIMYVRIFVLIFSLLVLYVYHRMRQDYRSGSSPWQRNPTYFDYWDGHRRSFHELFHVFR
jgi:hypothetical protein